MPLSETEELELLELERERAMSQAPKTLPPSTAESFARGVSGGATLGWSDEMAGAFGAIISKLSGDPSSMAKLYTEARNIDRERTTAATQAHPMASTLGQVGGTLATLAIPGGAVAKGGSILAKAGQAAKAGAVIGGVATLGSSEGTPLQQAKQTAVGAGVGGLTAGLLTGGVAAALPVAKKVVTGPFTKQYMPATAAAAERLGVPVTASTVSKSPAVQTLETIGAKGIFGGKLAERAEETGIKLKQSADNMVSQASKISNPTVAGQQMLRSAQKYQENYFNLRSRLYDDARLPSTEIKYKPAPGTAGRIDYATMKTDMRRKVAIPVDTTDTAKYVDELIKEERFAQRGSNKTTPLYNELTDIKKALGPRYDKDGNVIGIPAREIEAKVRKYANRANFGNPVETGDPAKWRSLSSKLDNDLDAALKKQRPDLHEAKSRADAYYQDGLHTLQNSTIEKIFELKDRPDQIVDAIIRPQMSESDLGRVIQVVGKQNLPEIQGFTLKHIFDNATSHQTGKLTASALDRNIGAYGTKLKQILTPDQYSRLQDINTVMRGYQRGQKVAEGSQTSFIGKLMAEGGIALTSIRYALNIVLGDAAFTSFINSVAGQKYLTSGLGKQAVKSAASLKLPIGPISALTGGAMASEDNAK